MSVFLVAAALAADPASMVTLSTGGVTVVEGKTRTPAPAAPFLLGAGQTLELAAGAHVVILRSGGAFSADGPRTVDAKSLAPAASGTDAVGDLLSKRTSLAGAGAARAGGLAVTRPVPGAPTFALTEVRWRCEACGPQDVAVVDLREDEVVWTGNGDGKVTYAGPALKPGVYAVRVGTQEVSLRVAPSSERDTLLAGITLANPADKAAAEAGALLLAGYPTDALTRLEAAGLTTLVQQTEQVAGVDAR
jgi:hypothetical protein